MWKKRTIQTVKYHSIVGGIKNEPGKTIHEDTQENKMIYEQGGLPQNE